MTPDEVSNHSRGKQNNGDAAIHPVPRDEAICSQPPETLVSHASDPGLSEDLALAMLKRPDIPSAVLEALHNNSSAIQHRKVRLALACHLKTPRHISVPLLRRLYTFELMQLALTPTAPADIKKLADEALINRLDTISLGEKLSLAKRASGIVAGALLLDQDLRVIRTALENARLTEASVIKSLNRHATSAALVEAVCHHPKWSPRQEIRIALLRSDKIPLAKAMEFSHSMSRALLQEVLRNSRLPAATKAALLKDRSDTNPTG
jgi:hypothetical protein